MNAVIAPPKRSRTVIDPPLTTSKFGSTTSRCLVVTMGCLWVAAMALPASAQPIARGFAGRTLYARGGELLDGRTADAAGLQTAWMKPLSSPGGANSIVDVAMFVDSQDAVEYLEIESPVAGSETEKRTVMRLRFGTMGPENRIIDETEAIRLSNNEMRRMKRRGQTGEVVRKTIPNVMMVSLADDGTLERRDGEDGTAIWTTRVGNPEFGYGKIGLNGTHVAVDNGSNLILVDVATGRVPITVPVGAISSFGVRIAGQRAVIHSDVGLVEAYDLGDMVRDPFIERVQGSPLFRPMTNIDQNEIIWATDRGYLYVGRFNGRPSIPFRLSLTGRVMGGVARATGHRYFFATDRGQAYALRTVADGKVLWSEPLGAPIYARPFIVGDNVIFTTDVGTSFAVDINSGDSLWDRPVSGLSELFAAVGDRGYGLSSRGNLVELDVESAKVRQLGGGIRPAKIIFNDQTDRLYLMDTRGVVQCLRPANMPFPTMLTQNDVQPNKPAIAAAIAKPGAPAATPADPAADPFGATPDAGGNDPFGGDPFGGGDGGAGGDDPFGGDPFGGGDPFN